MEHDFTSLTMVMSVGNVFLLLFKDHITFISSRDKLYPADNKEKTIALNGLMKKYQPEGGYEPIKTDMDVLKGVVVMKIVPESLRGKYKIGQNMDMKSRIDLARQILERNSHTAKETLDVMGFEIIDNELELVDDTPW